MEGKRVQLLIILVEEGNVKREFWRVKGVIIVELRFNNLNYCFSIVWRIGIFSTDIIV